MENKNMRKLNVTVQCVAVYNSSIMVPRELTFEEAIKYAKEHFDKFIGKEWLVQNLATREPDICSVYIDTK